MCRLRRVFAGGGTGPLPPAGPETATDAFIDPCINFYKSSAAFLDIGSIVLEPSILASCNLPFPAIKELNLKARDFTAFFSLTFFLYRKLAVFWLRFDYATIKKTMDCAGNDDQDLKRPIGA